MQRKHKYSPIHNRMRFITKVDPVGVTQQQFYHQCNINSIIEKFNKTGVLSSGVSSDRKPQFGDFTQEISPQTALNARNDLIAKYGSLPENVKNRFKSVTEFLAYAELPHNWKELESMFNPGAGEPAKAPAPGSPDPA